MTDVFVAGVGMIPFVKPSKSPSFRTMAAMAIKYALQDADIEPNLVEQAYAGFIYGDTGSGQHALYDAFQTGIPVFNVNNACCSGSSALLLARQAIMSGQIECALAFGFEEMRPGAITSDSGGREVVGDRINAMLDERGYSEGALAPRWFGAAGEQYLAEYDASPDIFAKVAVKTRKHAENNPMAILRSPLSVDEVVNAPVIYGDYLTRLMACPPSCGAAAAILVSKKLSKKLGGRRCIRIAAQHMATDTQVSWDNPMNATGKEMVERVSKEVYDESGLGPSDVDVIELHDCFTPNEVMTYENLGLCEPGEGPRIIDDRDNTYGGKWVINPSGGLMSKGHPIGATGVAQCVELVNQLRGEAGLRQVPNANVALQHNIGLVAGAILTMYVR